MEEYVLATFMYYIRYSQFKPHHHFRFKNRHIHTLISVPVDNAEVGLAIFGYQTHEMWLWEALKFGWKDDEGWKTLLGEVCEWKITWS